MEIQNTQVGQVFASLAPKNSEVVETDIQSNPAVRNSSEQTTLSDTRQRKTQVAVDESSNSERQQILSQASSAQADKSKEERNGVELDDAVAKVESFLKVQNRDLAFTIDENTNRSVVTVKDSKSGDVIRQIPSEEVLKLADRIQELQQDVGDSVGVFINNRV